MKFSYLASALLEQSCVFYFDTNSISGAVDWSEPHVLFEGRAIVDFNTDPKTGVVLGPLIILSLVLYPFTHLHKLRNGAAWGNTAITVVHVT